MPVCQHDACARPQEMGAVEGVSLKRWERSLLRRPFDWGPSLTQLTGVITIRGPTERLQKQDFSYENLFVRLIS